MKNTTWAENRNLEYGIKRINLLKEEMGSIQRTFTSEGKLYVEFENGMNLQLHEDEITHQAEELLVSQLEAIRHR
jgi:hypothetical protein